MMRRQDVLAERGLTHFDVMDEGDGEGEYVMDETEDGWERVYIKDIINES